MRAPLKTALASWAPSINIIIIIIIIIDSPKLHSDTSLAMKCWLSDPASNEYSVALSSVLRLSLSPISTYRILMVAQSWDSCNPQPLDRSNS